MSVCLDGDRRRAGPERIRQARCDFDPSDPGAVFASARSRDVRLATKMLLTKAEQVSDDGAHAAALRASSGHDGPVAASARSGSAYGRTERGVRIRGWRSRADLGCAVELGANASGDVESVRRP